MKAMTQVENVVMNLTGCTRQIANTVANFILDIEEETSKENTLPDEA